MYVEDTIRRFAVFGDNLVRSDRHWGHSHEVSHTSSRLQIMRHGRALALRKGLSETITKERAGTTAISTDKIQYLDKFAVLRKILEGAGQTVIGYRIRGVREILEMRRIRCRFRCVEEMLEHAEETAISL